MIALHESIWLSPWQQLQDWQLPKLIAYEVVCFLTRPYAQCIKWLSVITNIHQCIQTVVDFTGSEKWAGLLSLKRLCSSLAADDEVSESTQWMHIICERQRSSIKTKDSLIVSDDKSISHLSNSDSFYPSTARVRTSSDLNSSVMYTEAVSAYVHSLLPKDLPRFDPWWPLPSPAVFR